MNATKETIDYAIAIATSYSNIDIDEFGHVSFNGIFIEQGNQSEDEVADVRYLLRRDGIHTDWDDDGQLVVCE